MYNLQPSVSHSFRRASLDDLGMLLALNAELDFDNWSQERFEQVFELDLPCWLALNEDGALIGCVVYLICFDEVRIINVTIARAYQNQGYGQRLLVHALEDSREFSVNYALLEVRIDNFKALKLYTRLGFKILCVREGYFTDKVLQDGYFMQLTLKNIVN